MKTAGIISEYNPFHKGHQYHINETAKFADGIISVMSPNVCQRGEFSFFDKFGRAHAAVLCGADLVVELPAEYAVSSADIFARGGAEILSYLGADILSFGSESADVRMLERASKENLSDNTEIKALLASGVSYPRALGEYLEKKGFSLGPNDILGLKYMTAGFDFSFLPVKRIGCEHDGRGETEYTSASDIRKKGLRQSKEFIPPEAYGVFIKQPVFDKEKADMLELSFLKHLTAEELKKNRLVSEGLENRIIPAVRDAADLEEALFSVKTKRYSLARLRRLFLSLYLDIPPAEGVPVPYIRVLALNKKGAEILHTAKKNCPVPIITALGDGVKAGETGKIFSEKEGFITDIYNFCRGVKNGEDQRYSPHIL